MGLGSWRPDTAQELLDFLDRLPELMERFKAELGGVFDACQEAGQLGKETSEVTEELTGLLADVHDKSVVLPRIFREENGFWL